MKTILITHFAVFLFLLPSLSGAQLISVSGFVNDASGKALKNVSIFEANSGIGTITNENGFYKLTLDKGNLNLKISDNGFQSLQKQMELNSDTTLVHKLQPLMHSRKHKKDDDLHADVKAEKKSSRRALKLF